MKWAVDPVTFITTVLRDPETRRPFTLLPAEIAFLELALRTDEDGRLLHPELLYCRNQEVRARQRSLLSSSSPSSSCSAAGMLRPTCVANDLEQAQSRVFEMVRRIIEASPLLRREAKVTANKISLPVQRLRIAPWPLNTRARLVPTPPSRLRRAVGLHLRERSQALFDEMVAVPTRKISCRLVVSHAGFSGESPACWKNLYNRGLAQPLVGTDLYAGDGLLMFWSHVPIAPWQDPSGSRDMEQVPAAQPVSADDREQVRRQRLLLHRSSDLRRLRRP